MKLFSDFPILGEIVAKCDTQAALNWRYTNSSSYINLTSVPHIHGRFLSMQVFLHEALRVMLLAGLDDVVLGFPCFGGECSLVRFTVVLNWLFSSSTSYINIAYAAHIHGRFV